MIKEHEDIIMDINLVLSGIFNSYEKDIKFTIHYMDAEFKAIEVFILNSELTSKEFRKLIEEIKKYNDIVNDIYTMEEGRLFTIYLKPIEDIRSIKINKLQNKISDEANNKI